MKSLRVTTARADRTAGSSLFRFNHQPRRLQSLLVLVVFTLSLAFSAVTLTPAQAAGLERSNNPAPIQQANSDLLVTLKSSAAGTVSPGDVLTYTLQVTNQSETAQNSIVVNAPLPAGTTYVPQSTRVVFKRLYTYEDHFETAAYNNSNGSLAWAANWWTEMGADSGTDPTNGTTRIVIGPAGGRLRFDGSNYDSNLFRNASLAMATSATLSLDYFVNGSIEANDRFSLERYSGGSYLNMASFDGTTLASSGHLSYDISAYVNTSFRFRLTTSGFLDGAGDASEYLEIDNVMVEIARASALLPLDNLPGGTNTDLADGTLPNLVTTSDAINLPADELMEITYQVQINNPLTPGVSEITSSASVTSNSVTIPVTAVDEAPPIVEVPCTVATDLVVYADPEPSYTGQEMTYYAHVEVVPEDPENIPTGWVRIVDSDGNEWGGGIPPTLPLVNGMASFKHTYLYAGTKEITAEYIPDSSCYLADVITPDMNVVHEVLQATTEMTLDTAADPAAPEIDDLLGYTFTVTNTGNQPLDGLSLSADLTGLSAITCLATSLEPAAFTTCSATYPVTFADVLLGQVSLTVEASATSPLGAPVSAADSLTLDTTNPPPPSLLPDSMGTDFNTPVMFNIATNDTAHGTGNSLVLASIDLDVTTPGIQNSFTDTYGNLWVVDASGTVTFTPFENAVGPFSIQYSLQDALGQSAAAAALTVAVAPPFPPNTMNDTANTAFNTPVTVNVVANDLPNGTGNSLVLSTIDLNAGLAGNQLEYTLNGHTWAANPATGEVTFTPAEDATGDIAIAYSIEDELGLHGMADLTIRIALPAAPTAVDDEGTTNFNVPCVLTDITANDTAYGTRNQIDRASIDLNPSGAGQQTLFIDDDSHLWTVDTSTGAVTFTPAGNFTGTASLPYRVKDEAGQETEAILRVTVPRPSAPSAAADSATTMVNLAATLANITANDTAHGVGNSLLLTTIDLNAEALGNQASITLEGHTWTVNPDTGAVTFTPAADFIGEASLSYSVEDLLGQEGTALLTVRVEPTFDLTSFTAQRVSDTSVTLNWSTSNEVASAGYRLLRAAENDITQAVEVAALPAGSSPYTFSDTTLPEAGKYWYWLVKVLVNSTEMTSGPISVDTVLPNYPLYLPLILK